MLDDIADVTNRLRSDLILLAGDIINISLSDLPSALDMVLRLNARDGVFMIQGNHDVIQGPDRFDHAVRRRGINLLVDQAATITARGVPFQLLGTRWTSDWFRDESVSYTAGLRDPSLFAMMLAHHPHSWDAAAAAGIPLVISGHTHGGQIMLTDRIGAGPLRFKYWSGQYDGPDSTLIVSNGVGNWFPLRINAPAEILKITMHPKA
jgi:predicted MPP superfamily phosphohydrolase